MKKLLSIFLSIMLIFSTLTVLMALPTAAAAPVNITASAGGFVDKATAESGVSTTVKATPYYGNSFAGWYNEDGLVSTSAVYTGVITKDLTAKFNAYNQIVDGNFESGTENAVSYFTTNHAFTDVSVANIPSSGNATHGNKALLVKTEGGVANSVIYTINAPVTVEKNKKYILSYSFYAMSQNGANYKSRVGLHAEASNNNQIWNPAATVPKHAFTWRYENADGTTPEPAQWTYLGNTATSKVFVTTHHSVQTGAEKWVDVNLVFETGEDASLFKAGEDTGNIWFTIGVGNDEAPPADGSPNFYIDNISFTEAGSAYADKISVSAGTGGRVEVAEKSKLPGVLNYYNTAGATKGDAHTTHLVAGATAYAQMVGNVKYTATANEGYSFAGWYDGDNNLVSTSETYTFTNDGNYTAKFDASMGSTDGGYVVDNGDGTKTATPYFGNLFDAWYDSSNQVISRNEKIDAATYPNAVARFYIHNQVKDGDFSGGTNNVLLDGTIPSAEVLADADGNKFLRLSATHTDKHLTAFSWKFTVEKGKKYIVSYKAREALNAEGAPLSSESAGYRRQIRPVAANGTYEWKNVTFADQRYYVYGNKQNYAQETNVAMLPNGGATLNPPAEYGTADVFAKYASDKTDWVTYNFILDATSLTAGADNLFANGTSVDFGLILGLNGAGTMVMDVDDIVISEVKEEYGISANPEGGTITQDRRASTTALPVTYTAYPDADANYQFEGWYNSDNSARVAISETYTPTSAVNLTAKFKSSKLGFERVNGDSITAYPYYGNKFDGWYQDGVLKSTERTVAVAESVGWTAKYKFGGNLLHDGGFEEFENTAAVYEEYKDYNPGSVKRVVATYVPGSGPQFGDYCLQIIPKQTNDNGKMKGLINIPTDVEAGKTYLWKFSYTYTSGAYDAGKDYLHISVDEADASGNVPWTDGKVDYSIHSQLASYDGIDLATWGWGRVAMKNGKTDAYSTNKNFSATNEWVDVYVMFTPTTSGKHFLSLGTQAAQTNVLAFDNMSLTEVSLGKTPTSVTAEANGTVASFRTDEAAYWSTVQIDQLTNDTVDKTGKVDFSNPYYVDIYGSYYAVPDLGYTFDGWYKGNLKVSEERELVVKTTGDGEYVAKFSIDENRYFATAITEKQDGVYGGYISSETEYNEILNGETVNFTAVAYNGNTFAGWYDKDTGALVSTDAAFDLAVVKNTKLVAKFNINNAFVDAGYENVDNAECGWDNGASVNFLNSYTGVSSLNIYAPGEVSRYEGLTVDANAIYHFSFMWKASDAEVAPEYVKVYNAATNAVLAEINNFEASADRNWQKAFVNFDTAAATAVTIEVKYNKQGASLFFDDFALFNTADADFTINATLKKEGNIFPGYLLSEGKQTASYGDSVTVTVAGYEKNIFDGWYEDGKKVSSDLSYTFTADSFANLTAEFTVNNIYPDSGFENTVKDTSLSHGDITDWVVNESQYLQWGFDVIVTDDSNAHSGSSVLKATHRTTDYSTVVTGLKEKTNYVFSFWWNFSQVGSFDLCIVNGVQTGLELTRGMGGTSDGTWQQVMIPFYTDQNTDVKLTFRYTAGSGSALMDDFALYESNFVGVYAAEGGSVTSDLNGGANGPADDGAVVTVTATPNAGNTFKGWYNYKNLQELLSTDETYTFTVTGPTYVIAYFEGDDVAPMNYFVDGDFENNCFEGLTFAHKFYSVEWCSYTVVKSNSSNTITPISGDKMLQVGAQSRNSNFTLKNLTPHTDYTLSFYYAVDPGVIFDSMMVVRYLEESAGQLVQDSEAHEHKLGYQYYHTYASNFMEYNNLDNAMFDGEDNGGKWRRVEMTFNPGNRDTILLTFSMGKSLGGGFLYFDDMRITEGHTATEDVANGNFSDAANVNGWQGAFTTATEGANAYGKFNGEIHNVLKLDWAPALPYTLTFKAKSENGAKLAYGISAAGATSLFEDGKNTAATNASYGAVSLTNEWKEYSFNLATSTFETYKLFFKSMNGKDVCIDDVTLTKASGRTEITKLTFEDDTNTYIGVNASISHAQNEYNDRYFAVTGNEYKSGNKSLVMYSGASEGDDTYKSHRLAMDWAQLRILSGRRYGVTFWAKADVIGDEFVAQVSSTADDWSIATPLNKTVVAENTEWTQYYFEFSAPSLKNRLGCADLTFGSSSNRNEGDIYFDDVSVKEISNSAFSTSDKLYTEDISQNFFGNPSFEKADALTDAYVKTGDAFYGDKYLTVKAGDKIIIPVNTKPEYDVSTWLANYTFAASVRGNANAQGYVGIAYSADGSDRLTYADGSSTSLSVNTNGKWVRSGINFAEHRWTYMYLVIECTAGTFDVDYVSMFNQQRAFKENPQLKEVKVEFTGEYNDMTSLNKGNYIGGNILGLPENSYVVLVGDKVLSSAIDAEGRYDIINIPNGKYSMMIAASDAEFMTEWGDLTVTDEGISGLACERLDGTVLKIEGQGVRNGIVKIMDDETEWAYFTITNGQGNYAAYILDGAWYIQGTTKDPAALESFHLDLEEFTFAASEKDATPAVTTVTGESSPLNSDRSTPIMAVVTVMITAAALIVLTRKKGECK